MLVWPRARTEGRRCYGNFGCCLIRKQRDEVCEFPRLTIAPLAVDLTQRRLLPTLTVVKTSEDTFASNSQGLNSRSLSFALDHSPPKEDPVNNENKRRVFGSRIAMVSHACPEGTC